MCYLRKLLTPCQNEESGNIRKLDKNNVKFYNMWNNHALYLAHMTSHDLHEGLLVALKIFALSLKREKKWDKKAMVRNVVSWKRCDVTLCLPTSNVLLSDVLTFITKLENLRGKFLWIFEVFKGNVWGEILNSFTYLTTPEKNYWKGKYNVINSRVPTVAKASFN